jgi:hypothetical protein
MCGQRLDSMADEVICRRPEREHAVDRGPEPGRESGFHHLIIEAPGPGGNSPPG